MLRRARKPVRIERVRAARTPEERAWRAAATAVHRAAERWARAGVAQRAGAHAEYARALAAEERAATLYERRARAGSRLVGL